MLAFQRSEAPEMHPKALARLYREVVYRKIALVLYPEVRSETISVSATKCPTACGANVCKPSALASRRPIRKPLSIDLGLRVRSQPTLPEFIDQKYKLLEVLGSGSTGYVQHAVRRVDGQHVALKKMRSSDPEMINIARAEFELLKRIPVHPHVIQAIDFHDACTEAILAMEFFAGTTLDRAVRAAPCKCFPETRAHVLSTALFQAVGHLHKHNIVHRDIKPENVLVSLDFADLRLVDFNVSHSLDDGLSLTPTGTELYKAPEALRNEAMSKPQDVWTAGLCLFFMLSGHLPKRQNPSRCCKEEPEARGTQTAALDGSRWQHVSRPCKALLSSCLAFDYSERPTMAAVLEHEWVKSICSSNSSYAWFESSHAMECDSNGGSEYVVLEVEEPCLSRTSSSTTTMSCELDLEIAALHADNAVLRTGNAILQLMGDAVGCVEMMHRHAKQKPTCQPQVFDDPFEAPPKAQFRYSVCGFRANEPASLADSTATPSDVGLNSVIATPTESAASGAATPVPMVPGVFYRKIGFVPVHGRASVIVPSLLCWRADQFMRIPSGIVQRTRAFFERSTAIPSFFVQPRS